MLADIRRFYRDARAVLDGPSPTTATLGEWLDERGYGRPFRDHFLVPDHVGRVVDRRRPRRSSSLSTYLLRFLDNHGLIGYGNAPQWRVVRGGSRAYVERLVAVAPGGLGADGRRRSPTSGATRSA